MGSQVSDAEMDQIGELAAEESDRLDRWNMVFCTALEVLLAIACKSVMDTAAPSEDATTAIVFAEHMAADIANNTWGIKQ